MVGMFEQTLYAMAQNSVGTAAAEGWEGYAESHAVPDTHPPYVIWAGDGWVQVNPDVDADPEDEDFLAPERLWATLFDGQENLLGSLAVTATGVHSSWEPQ